jgi:methanogenic corrinoid protein MtbC1
MTMPVEIHQKLAQAVIDGKPEEAKIVAREAVEQGLDARACITGLTKGIQHAGKLHASGECLLPDLLNSADAMKAALNILEPTVVGDKKREVIALVVLEATDGDGKPLVGTMLTENNLEDDQDIPYLQWLS